ncbi:MAG TPA: hypothetical protein VIK25_06290 [Gemmatimonadaceae bacterium]
MLIKPRFFQRYTPRTAKSIWSAVNIKRSGELLAEGRMQPAGLAAFERGADSSAVRPTAIQFRGDADVKKPPTPA